MEYLKFEHALTMHNIKYVREYLLNKLFKPNEFKHKFKADYAIMIEGKPVVLIEIEGGVFSNGRHTRGIGYHNDLLKYNAAMCKMPLLRFTSDMVNSHPVRCAEFVHKYINDTIETDYLSNFVEFFKKKPKKHAAQHTRKVGKKIVKK